MVPIQPFTEQTLNRLLALAGRPNLSVYMPTHRTFPQRTQDPIRLKNLIKELEILLEQHYPQIASQALIAPFHALIDDHAFWNACPEAIAIFGGLEHFLVVGLHKAVPETAVVNSHPYLKPLLRLAPMTDRYQVLCLSRDSVRVYEGSMQSLQEVSLPEAVPTNQNQALGDELTPRDQRGHPDGFSGGGERGDPMMHESGGSGKQEEINLDRERFFRIVDRRITEHCSRVSKLPLVLVALAENQAVFRAQSRNPFLLPVGIEQDPATLTAAQLTSACGELIRLRQDDRLDEALGRYAKAVGQRLSAHELPEIARAATEGRVALLLVEAERTVNGVMDGLSGDLALQSNDEAGSDDVLDEMILAVMQHGGEVIVLPPERSMPSETGAAAIYRY
ncbi:hypothetical protein G7013_04410 [Pseudomonas viridiflava]|uniref:baeRF3 domain-containing protein n=1 Tax=Pseudomonas viridiflava TaxID=33069 RepID=UPI0015E2B33B|nr:hypothetical protein [Pseudomonas viridiflava]MBA1228893.1 hypothetical protein [Pseudomonas viridiflava]